VRLLGLIDTHSHLLARIGPNPNTSHGDTRLLENVSANIAERVSVQRAPTSAPHSAGDVCSGEPDTIAPTECDSRPLKLAELHRPPERENCRSGQRWIPPTSVPGSETRSRSEDI